MPASIVRTPLVSLGFIDPVMLVLRASLAYSRFVVGEFTVKKKIKNKKKMYCFYKINLLECVLGSKIWGCKVSVTWLPVCNVRYSCLSYIKARVLNSNLTEKSSAGEGFLLFSSNTWGSGLCPALVGVGGGGGVTACLGPELMVPGPSVHTPAFPTHPLAIGDREKLRCFKSLGPPFGVWDEDQGPGKLGWGSPRHSPIHRDRFSSLCDHGAS